jgi:hypothetical protein
MTKEEKFEKIARISLNLEERAKAYAQNRIESLSSQERLKQLRGPKEDNVFLLERIGRLKYMNDFYKAMAAERQYSLELADKKAKAKDEA